MSGCATNTASACSITPIDADTASPRACFQFSEDLPARTDFSPFVAVAGTDKPALSVAEKQLCVEGLTHGQHYTVTLRAGLPSVVHETLSKSADFAIYVRDRKPFGAVLDFGLCAAADRPARHSDHQRQYPFSRGRDLSHQRPQSDRYHRAASAIGRGDFQRSLDRSDIEQLEELARHARCGTANSPSSRARSMPKSPPRSRSTRRSAISSPASM